MPIYNYAGLFPNFLKQVEPKRFDKQSSTSSYRVSHFQVTPETPPSSAALLLSRNGIGYVGSVLHPLILEGKRLTEEQSLRIGGLLDTGLKPSTEYKHYGSFEVYELPDYPDWVLKKPFSGKTGDVFYSALVSRVVSTKSNNVMPALAIVEVNGTPCLIQKRIPEDYTIIGSGLKENTWQYIISTKQKLVDALEQLIEDITAKTGARIEDVSYYEPAHGLRRFAYNLALPTETADALLAGLNVEVEPEKLKLFDYASCSPSEPAADSIPLFPMFINRSYAG